MIVYNLSLNKQAIKALEQIDEPYYSKLKEAIYNLANEPRPQGYKKLKGRDAYRIRVANYRVIYEILDQVLQIEVIAIGHRKEVYD
jgi:mRNA interferase RelE/StbE